MQKFIMQFEIDLKNKTLTVSSYYLYSNCFANYRTDNSVLQ